LKILESGLIRPAYKNRINNLQQTTSAFMLNLVLKPQTLRTRNYNLYWHQSHDVWKAPHYDVRHWPENYALYFTESQQFPGFAESLSILTYMQYDEVKQWDDTLNHSGNQQDRGAFYMQFKNDRAALLLQKV